MKTLLRLLTSNTVHKKKRKKKVPLSFSNSNVSKQLTWLSADPVPMVSSSKWEGRRETMGSRVGRRKKNEQGLKCVKGSNWPLLLHLRTARRLRLYRCVHTWGSLRQDRSLFLYNLHAAAVWSPPLIFISDSPTSVSGRCLFHLHLCYTHAHTPSWHPDEIRWHMCVSLCVCFLW